MHNLELPLMKLGGLNSCFTDFPLVWLERAKFSNQHPFGAGEKTSAHFRQEVYVRRDLMRVQMRCRSQDYVRLIGKSDSLHAAALISPSVHCCHGCRRLRAWQWLSAEGYSSRGWNKAPPLLSLPFKLNRFFFFSTALSWLTFSLSVWLWRLMLPKI